jgi:uncharacterized protein YdhG (YjbR/CyaY superfamily)
MQSKAKTVAEYIAALPEERRAAIKAVRAVVKKHLPAGFKAAGKKLDMGKACIRFKQLEDLPLDVIAEVAAAIPMKQYIEIARAAHARKK